VAHTHSTSAREVERGPEVIRLDPFETRLA
jgi:hypothetical protein